jgi:hypothetical protein
MPPTNDILAIHGAQENMNGGILIHGDPSTISSIAQECKVGQTFVTKVIDELNANGSRILCPSEKECEKRYMKISVGGAGGHWIWTCERLWVAAVAMGRNIF